MPADDPIEHGDDSPEDQNRARGSLLMDPQTISRILGLLLFGLLFWLQAPPVFLQKAGWASYVFVAIIWIGELLAYAIGLAGVIVLLIFLGSHIIYLLRRARRWYRLQEIRSWRAKRACNYRK